jgi:hypothetical protein
VRSPLARIRASDIMSIDISRLTLRRRLEGNRGSRNRHILTNEIGCWTRRTGR